MEDRNIYRDIAERTDGDIYIGVVGPVRTGKSTFIKKFMDTLVIPNIDGKYKTDRAIDELPQSAAGRTIMTTEPKFIPEDAIEVNLEDNASFRVRMIDCVGYIVPSSIGYIENDMPRMVKTPWVEEEIPFNMAAEIGTKKVITDHSTIGLVVTTDGSISDIPRDEYCEAEERVINELKELNKPFVVMLNCVDPDSENSQMLCDELREKYRVPVTAVNCEQLDEEQIKEILTLVLFEFPIKEISVNMPKWLVSLEKDHTLRKNILGMLGRSSTDLRKIADIYSLKDACACSDHINNASIEDMNLGNGCVKMRLDMSSELFYSVLGEKTGLEINGESGLMKCVTELAEIKKKYDKIKHALDEVEATGYGIVMPTLDELTLEEPEMMKQGGRYGVKLKASAPSIHMLKADINTEVAPIVGSEKQSEELVLYLLKEFEENPSMIWQSNIFGKSLHELVNEGLHNKLYKMPADARGKLRETIERVINEGCNGLICIII